MPHKDPAARRAYSMRYRACGPLRRPRLTPEERFWAKVNKDGPIPIHRPDLGQCWLWTGGHGRYGFFTISTARQVSAHRLSLEMALGRPLEPGEQACHHCDNPLCVRPNHLFAGTNSDNVRDMYAKGRNSGRNPPIHRGDDHHSRRNPKKACKRGHPFPESMGKSGSCQPCHRERNRIWMREHYQRRTA